MNAPLRGGTDAARQPTEKHCARCGQLRFLFPADPAWGDVPTPLCTTDWQRYAEARANETYVDWNDAFDNATDDELAENIHPRPGRS